MPPVSAIESCVGRVNLIVSEDKSCNRRNMTVGLCGIKEIRGVNKAWYYLESNLICL